VDSGLRWKSGVKKHQLRNHSNFVGGGGLGSGGSGGDDDCWLLGVGCYSW
jgi:hypothetical protein